MHPFIRLGDNRWLIYVRGAIFRCGGRPTEDMTAAEKASQRRPRQKMRTRGVSSCSTHVRQVRGIRQSRRVCEGKAAAKAAQKLAKKAEDKAIARKRGLKAPEPPKVGENQHHKSKKNQAQSTSIR